MVTKRQKFIGKLKIDIVGYPFNLLLLSHFFSEVTDSFIHCNSIHLFINISFSIAMALRCHHSLLKLQTGMKSHTSPKR